MILPYKPDLLTADPILGLHCMVLLFPPLMNFKSFFFVDQIEKEDWADHDTGPIIENRKGFLTFVKSK